VRSFRSINKTSLAEMPLLVEMLLSAGPSDGTLRSIGVTVRRERRWTSADPTPARKLVRSIRWQWTFSASHAC